MKQINLLLMLILGILYPAYGDIVDYAKEGNLELG